MKIISCHIENFGKLHDFDVSFSDGCNVICEDNGWGKSTFAAFVRAMFYGLEGEKKRSSLENERKRYKPWQGGAFGGSMEFETAQGRFRVSRFFADKEAGDVFELRDAASNLISTQYSRNLGAELFGINSESFMKTVFIGQNGCETAVTDDVNAKIGNLADSPQDMNCYETALKRLDGVLNALNPNRVSGSINARKNDIQRLERELRDSESLESAYEDQCSLLEQEETEYSRITSELAANREEQKRVAQLQNKIAIRNEYRRLEAELEKSTAAVQELRSRFPAEVPEINDIKEKIAECTELAKAGERVDSLRLTEAEEQEFRRLTTRFAAIQIPEPAELEQKIELAGELAEQRAIMSRECLTGEEEYRLNELKAVCEAEPGVREVMGLWNERCSKKDTLASRRSNLEMSLAMLESERSKAGQSKNTALTVVGTAAGAVLTIIGFVLAVMFGALIPNRPGTVAGLAAIIIGAALLVISAVSRSREKKRVDEAIEAVPATTPAIDALKQELETDEKQIDSTDALTAQFLSRYGHEFNESTVLVILQQIFSETLEYEKLLQKAQRAEKSDCAERVRAASLELRRYFERFDLEFDEQHCSDRLYRLKELSDRYSRMLSRNANLKSAAARYDTLADSICSFIRKYGFTPEDEPAVQLGEIREMASDLADADKQATEASEQFKIFTKENDISGLEGTEIEENASLSDLNARGSELEKQLEEAHKTILNYKRIIEEFREKLERREENAAELAGLKEVQEEELRRHRLVSKAKEKLTRAKENMTARYSQPLLDRFGHYYGLIVKKEAAGYHLDANTELTVDEYGMQRSVDTLSTGYRDLIGLSLRMALVDAMYEEELPPVVMDDPFTNLDDDKLGAAHDFLEDIAERYQVLYFTCSRARV